MFLVASPRFHLVDAEVYYAEIHAHEHLVQYQELRVPTEQEKLLIISSVRRIQLKYGSYPPDA